MSAPIDISDPPHLWLRLLPDGSLYLALAGPQLRDALHARLAQPAVVQPLQANRITVALVDIAGLSSIGSAEIELIAGWLAPSLVTCGCHRLALVAPANILKLLGPSARDLIKRAAPQLRFEFFDQQATAGQWLFSNEGPVPSSRSAAPPGVSPTAGPTMPSVSSVPLTAPHPPPVHSASSPPIISSSNKPTEQPPPPTPGVSALAQTTLPSTQSPLAPRKPGAPSNPGAPSQPSPVQPSAQPQAQPSSPQPSSPQASSAQPTAPRAAEATLKQAPSPQPLPPPPPPAPAPIGAATKPTAQPLPTPERPAQLRLLPMLQPASWDGARVAMGRPLSTAQAGKLDHNPFVTISAGDAPRRFVLLRDDAGPKTFDDLLAEALRNVDDLDLTIEPRPLPNGGPIFYRCLEPHAEAGILAPGFLARLHKLVGHDVLAVGVPTKGTLLATRVSPENGVMLQGLAQMVAQLFETNRDTALSPHMFLIDKGQLKGSIRLEVTGSNEQKKPSMAPPPQAAPQAPGLKVLHARTIAEAHLYMDLRGAEPGTRNKRLVPMGDDLVAVYEARCFDEQTPTRFAFLVEDLNAAGNAYGGRAPSRIIAPDEFMLWADIRSKRVPASPEGLDPESRKRAKLMLEDAATCLEECMKFIPMGAERVPESLMALRDRWEKLSITHGRFDRARLDIVAKTYRGLAAKF